ncbi:MAG: hypothetical protein EXR55_04170 [Dehalococcoidia bacterium]|nr:hypothetical protein [Dehalococcoidia bacterium]
MPKPAPTVDEVTKPFWDACNQRKLTVQHCSNCNRFQYPPEKTCANCGNEKSLTWREVSGRGTIITYTVMHDVRQRTFQADQPFNIAVIALEDDPAVKVFSNLPGTPVDKVPVGARVKVEFQAVHTGQLVPEWRVVS